MGSDWRGTRSDWRRTGSDYGEWGRIGGERGRTGRERGRTVGNMVGLAENGVGLMGNGVGLGGNGGRTRVGMGVGLGRKRGRTRENGVGLVGNRVGLAGTGVGLGGNGNRTCRSDLRVGLGGSDWSIRGGASSFGPTLCLRCAQTARLYVKRGRAGCMGQGEPFEGRKSRKGIIVLNGIITTFHVIFSYSRKTRTCGHIS